jgi:lipopolysaccharide export system permease protein
MTLRIDGSEQNGTRLRGIFTALDDKSGTRISATAAEGQFLSTDDPDTIIFRLQRGRLIQEGPKFATPRTLSFNSYDLPINLPAVDSFRGRGGNVEKELVLPEVWGRAYGGRAATSADQLASRANLHFRLVEIAMMLMLPMLGIALAVPPKRSNSSLGIFVGIVLVVTYHKINQYAEDAGAQGRLQPELALWLPFLGLVVLIVWMYHVIAHRPGGQPIGALEAAFAKLGKVVRKVAPKRQFKRIEAKA